MMQRFLHNDLHRLVALLQAAGNGFRMYTERDLGLPAALLRLLDDAAREYKVLGRDDNESQMLSLKAELTTAQRGVDPATLQKVSVRRGELQNTIAFKVLQAVELQLRTDLQRVAQPLQGAEELIGQIVIAGVQKRLVTDDDIRNATTQAAIQALWVLLGADADIAIAQKRVLLMVSAFDAGLLMDAALARLRSPFPTEVARGSG